MTDKELNTDDLDLSVLDLRKLSSANLDDLDKADKKAKRLVTMIGELSERNEFDPYIYGFFMENIVVTSFASWLTMTHQKTEFNDRETLNIISKLLKQLMDTSPKIMEYTKTKVEEFEKKAKEMS